MSIRFTPDDWKRIRTGYGRWWDKTLDRPLIPITLYGKDPGRPQPSAPLLTQATCADLSIPADDLIDRIDYELSRYEYLGDAFPYVNFDCFGPGVAAAFLGAKLDNSTGGVWFHPARETDIRDLHLEYDPDNVWLRRIKDIYAAGMKRWQGQVLMGMADLGGVLDILSTFRPSERLLLDLYDEPEEVKRVVREIHDLWLGFCRELHDALGPMAPGYSDWAKIYSETPSYVIQCDFCYMISPAFFEEFVKPELTVMCKTLDHTMYHLDGIGQLNKLDSLLAIPELDAVQWVPGDGKPPQEEWPEVLEKIRSAGKNIQLFGGLRALGIVEKQFGTGKGIHLMPLRDSLERKAEYLTALEKYHVI